MWYCCHNQWKKKSINIYFFLIQFWYITTLRLKFILKESILNCVSSVFAKVWILANNYNSSVSISLICLHSWFNFRLIYLKPFWKIKLSQFRVQILSSGVCLKPTDVENPKYLLTLKASILFQILLLANFPFLTFPIIKVLFLCVCFTLKMVVE
jgi:hypothetical protein